VKALMPNDAHLHRWLDMARSASSSGPACAHLLGRLKDRARLGLAFNEMVANGDSRRRS
jgi:urocanate hydratase